MSFRARTLGSALPHSWTSALGRCLTSAFPSTLTSTFTSTLSNALTSAGRAANSHILLDMFNTLLLILTHPNILLDMLNPLPMLLLTNLLTSRRIPVIQHLNRKNSIKREPRNIPIQNNRIRNLLQRRKNPRRRARKVIEHLLPNEHQPPSTSPHTTVTYRKSAQLPRRPLLPHRINLRHFTRNPQHPRPRLQVPEQLPTHNLARPQKRVDRCRDPCHEHRSSGTAPGVHQYQRTDHNVLHSDERGLAERAIRKPSAHAIGQRDQKTRTLQQITRKRESRGGLAADEFDELRDLDDAGSGDDGYAEGFADAEFDAGGV